MFAWLVKPSHRVGKSRRNTQQRDRRRKRSHHEAQLPQKVLPPWTLPPAPSLPYVALLRQDAVKQDESHHAADVRHHDQEYESPNDQHGDEGSQNCGVNVREISLHEMAGRSRALRVKVRRKIEASTRAHLSRQQADQRQL